MTFDISGDFEDIVDNRASIDLTVNGNTDEGLQAVSLPVKLSEVEASLGRYTAEDRVFLFSQNGDSNSTKSIQEGRGKTRKGRRRVVTESMASKSLGEMSLPRLSLPKSQNSTHSKPTVRLGKIGR